MSATAHQRRRRLEKEKAKKVEAPAPVAKPADPDLNSPKPLEVADAPKDGLAAEIEAMSDEELAANYEDILGKKPHHMAKRATLEAQLLEAMK